MSMDIKKYKGFAIKPLLHIRGWEGPNKGKWVLGHYMLVDDETSEVLPVSHDPEYCQTREEALEITFQMASDFIDAQNYMCL